MSYQEEGYAEDYSAKMPRPESKIPLSDQEKSISQLETTIDRLYERLRPILTPSTEENRKELADETMKIQSPLAESVGINNRLILKQASRLENIITHLEC